MSEVESIEDVLAAHWRLSTPGGYITCACRQVLGQRGVTAPEDASARHRAHLADAIRAHLAEVAGRDDVRQAGWDALIDASGQDWPEQAAAVLGAFLQAIGDQP